MITAIQLEAVCILHSCFALHTLIKLSPQNKWDLEAEMDRKAIMPITLLQSHFENFMIDNDIKERVLQIYHNQYNNIVSNRKYLIPFYLQNKILDSIDVLITPDAPNGSLFEDFVLGYSQCIPQDHLWKTVSNHFKKRNLLVFQHLWHGLGGFSNHFLSRFERLNNI